VLDMMRDHTRAAGENECPGVRQILRGEVRDMSARPYLTVPTVELARMLRNSGAFHWYDGRRYPLDHATMRAELLQRALEAASPGIGVKHGAPESWSDR